jgi:c-di-GMP-binding flagellar brake protein YcgR
MWIIFPAVFVLLLILFLIFRKLGGGKFPWLKFYVKGRESGFAFKEINLLRKIAVENQLKNPLSLFWSIKQLDRSIRGVIIKWRSQRTEHDPANEAFLSKLYKFRKTVEFNLPKYKLGIKTTRKMSPHQKIKISLDSGNTFHSTVVENLRKYLAVSYPQGGRIPPGFTWRGQRLTIYFWRPDDAGYMFQSKVLEDFFDRKYPILHLAHSDNLTRSQRRGSVRVETNHAARLFPLKTIENSNEIIEKSGGLRCRLLDISEDGAAVLIGGKAKVGMPVKVQFTLNKITLILCGIVKGLTFNQKRNQSVLHLQAVPPSNRMRNTILSYVYNIFGERNDDMKKNVRRKPAPPPKSN